MSRAGLPTACLALLALSGCVRAAIQPVNGAGRAAPSLTASRAADSAAPGWYCPMHPDVTSAASGRCSKCGMQLLEGTPYDIQEYDVAMTTSPAAITPGVAFDLRLIVHHPATGDIVTEYETVHDKRYHLFVISQDLSVFQHLHPELGPDGAWTLQVTVPAAGYYRILSDFVPRRGSPQFVGRPLVTAGFDGDIGEGPAVLVADTADAKTVDTITARIDLEPRPLLAGQYGHLTFRLTDVPSGQPITDLQPYLGAFGHTLIMSADMVDVVHSHPSPGPDSDITRGSGGPLLTFDGYLPRPGLYRAWTQFQRHGQVSTVSFTFRVSSLDEAFRSP